MTKSILFAFALTLGFSAQAACPKISSSPISKDEVEAFLTERYATTSTKLGECTQIVKDAVDANAIEESVAEYDRLAKTVGIRTTNVFKCDATTETGKKLVAYGKVEKFEPTSYPHMPGGMVMVGGNGEKCESPKGIFYRLTNSYRAAE